MQTSTQEPTKSTMPQRATEREEHDVEVPLEPHWIELVDGATD